jgi:hypothetical protein
MQVAIEALLYPMLNLLNLLQTLLLNGLRMVWCLLRPLPPAAPYHLLAPAQAERAFAPPHHLNCRLTPGREIRASYSASNSSNQFPDAPSEPTSPVRTAGRSFVGFMVRT